MAPYTIRFFLSIIPIIESNRIDIKVFQFRVLDLISRLEENKKKLLRI